MRKPLVVALASVLMLGACGDSAGSRLNPLNWFGQRQAQQPETLTPKKGYPKQTDNRPLIDKIVGLKVDKTPGGVIIRATGLPPTQGYWKAALLPENDAKPVKGVVTYRFVAYPPPDPAAVSTRRSREITVGASLTDIQLERVRRIKVVAAKNALTARH
jgi:hypothetical protein